MFIMYVTCLPVTDFCVYIFPLHAFTTLLPCVRMHAGLCVWSRQFVCVLCTCTYMYIYMYIYIYMYVNKKNRLFSTLPLENLLPSVICCLLFQFKHLQCGLLCPVSCTDRVIHAFPKKTCGSPWPRNIYALVGGAPRHTVPVVVVCVSFREIVVRIFSAIAEN